MTTIFVAKLDFGVTESELLNLFQQYGTVAKVTVAKDKETNKSRGFAFVEMPNAEEANAAISALDGYSFNGRKCVIKEAENRSASKDGNNRGSGFQSNREERADSRPDRDSKPNYSNAGDKPKRIDSFNVPIVDDEDVVPPIVPSKPVVVKKKKEGDKYKLYDDTVDGKAKKPKMNAYRKSG